MQTKPASILAATFSVVVSLLAVTPDASALSLAGITNAEYKISIGNADIPELPGNFFNPGSDPFYTLPPYTRLTHCPPGPSSGCDPLAHPPLDLFAPDPTLPAPSTISIELVQLQLRSIEPIIVTGDTDTQWDMHVLLIGLPPVPGSPTAEFPPGQFNVDSFFDIEYRISFVNTDDGSSAPGGDVIGNLRLAAPPMPWFHDPANDLLIPGFDGNLPLPFEFASPDAGLIIGGLPLPLPPLLDGDLNNDGFVGIADLNIVLGAWNQNVPPGDWFSGDPSGDGFVGIDDLNAVLGNWNAGTPPINNNTVPEPATALLLAAASLTLTRRQ